MIYLFFFFFSSRRRHTRCSRDWSSDVCSSDLFAATACGLKKTGALDLGMLVSDEPASAAAVFTTNLVQAAPVVLCRKHLRKAKGRLRAVVVNSGNANCSVGPAGMTAARAPAVRAAAELGITPQEVFVCSTGVIGVPLPAERIL